MTEFWGKRSTSLVKKWFKIAASASLFFLYWSFTERSVNVCERSHLPPACISHWCHWSLWWELPAAWPSPASVLFLTSRGKHWRDQEKYVVQSIFGCNFSFTIWWRIVNRSTNCYYYTALNLRERFPCVCRGLCVCRVTQLEITSLAWAALRPAGVPGCLVCSSGWPPIPPQKQMSSNSCEETTDLLFINSYRLKLCCRCC